jgi:hypothetical protein
MLLATAVRQRKRNHLFWEQTAKLGGLGNPEREPHRGLVAFAGLRKQAGMLSRHAMPCSAVIMVTTMMFDDKCSIRALACIMISDADVNNDYYGCV